LTQGYNVNAVFSIVSLYSNRYVYIEFCPLGLYGGGKYLPNIPTWYTDKWFEENFKNHFVLIHKEAIEEIIINEKKMDYRILYIGRIHEN
jgi:hypothetical protein